MSRGPKVHAETRQRVQAMLDRGMSKPAIARAMGVNKSSIYLMVRRMKKGSGTRTLDPGFPPPRSMLDNAIRDAFRKAIGYDPIRDLDMRCRDAF